ncbi:hypothetical protein H5T88_03610 [bacterium]|nr:hypothetical protein [bacterium]
MQELKAPQNYYHRLYIATADVSPDGKFLSVVVVGGRSSRNRVLSVYSLETKDKWEVADEALHCFWDKRNVLWFDRKIGNNWSIWKWQPTHTWPQLVASKAFNPFPSPDGERVACFPHVDIKDQKSLKEASTILLFNGKGELRGRISLPGPPFFCEWSPTGNGMYVICLPGLSDPPYSLFHIVYLTLSPLSQRVVSSESYPIAGKGSWCLDDGGFVFVIREKFPSQGLPSSKVPLSFPGSHSKLSDFYFWKYNPEGENKKLELIWKEKGYNRSFAISPDGRFLLIPHEAINQQKKVYSYLHLVDLKRKKTSKITREEIKDGIRRVWYHRGLGGFCIATPYQVLLLKESGEMRTLVSLEG